MSPPCDPLVIVAAGCCRWLKASSFAESCVSCWMRQNFSRLMVFGRSLAFTRPPVHFSRERIHLYGCLRAGGIDHGIIWWKLKLAWPHLVSSELPPYRIAAEAVLLLR